MRRPRTILASTLAALGVVAAIGVAPAGAAPAATSCGPVKNNQIGWGTAFYPGSQPAGGIEGSSSYIYLEPVALCPNTNGGTNFSTSWNMVYGDHGYAQSGYMYRYGYGCSYSWAEQNDGSTFTDWNYACAAQGSRHAFRSLMSYNNGWHVTSSVDGVSIHTSSWSPFANWGDGTKFQLAFTGETYYGGSDVMGTPSKKTAYTAMGVQRYDNNQLVGTCGHANLSPYAQANAGRYATDAVHCDYVRTWTK